jgi:hypothetical protein
MPEPSLPPAVDLTLCTHAYWSSHQPHPRFAGCLAGILRDADTPQWGSEERVMQRQVLNACVALDRAAAEGVEWLLHIDDDEYFWLPSGSLHEHFACLDQACVALALYWNHEAVLLDGEVPSQRHPRLLFKKHPAALTLEQKQTIGSLLPGKPYFTAHWSGKTAARVLPGTLPDGVHMFEVESRVRGEAQTLCRDGDAQGLRAQYARAVTLTAAEVDRLQEGGYLIEPHAPLPIDGRAGDDRTLDAAPADRDTAP